jgi:hypothetical protein
VVPEDLHVIGATTDGRLWHTLRFEEPAGPLWQHFDDVKQKAGDVGCSSTWTAPGNSATSVILRASCTSSA